MVIENVNDGGSRLMDKGYDEGVLCTTFATSLLSLTDIQKEKLYFLYN